MSEKRKTRRGRPNLVNWDAIPVAEWRRNTVHELRSYIASTQGYKPTYQAVFNKRKDLLAKGAKVESQVAAGTRTRWEYSA